VCSLPVFPVRRIAAITAFALTACPATSTRANAVHILRGLADAREGTAEPIGLEALAARFNVQADE
jgi:hypothetical protein